MSMSVGDSFKKQYENEVKHEFQRKGSKLRHTVRYKPNIKGSSTVFQRIGPGIATQKARHGLVTPMNATHTPVECELEDYYAGDWVDRLDETKSAHEERRVLTEAGAYALGRKVDDLIITALSQATQKHSTPGIDRDKILAAMQLLGKKDVFEEGRMFAIVSWKQWSDLMKIDEFADSDKIADKDLPWLSGFSSKRWLGTTWMPHSGVTAAKKSNERGFWYHRDAVGCASGMEIRSDISWYGDRAAHFINNMMSMGACLIDPNGVVAIESS